MIGFYGMIDIIPNQLESSKDLIEYYHVTNQVFSHLYCKFCDMKSHCIGILHICLLPKFIMDPTFMVNKIKVL